jgi:hypothetical protein
MSSLNAICESTEKRLLRSAKRSVNPTVSALETIIPGVLLVSDPMMAGLKPSNSCLSELKFWIYIVEINVLFVRKAVLG